MNRLISGWTTLVRAGVVFAAGAGKAAACAICLAALDIAPGERLDNADRAVLAVPDGRGGWSVVADIKGAIPVDRVTLADAVPSNAGSATTLFVRDDLGHRWSVLGEVGTDNAAWLRGIARTPAPDDAALLADPGGAKTAWRARLELIVPHLQNEDPGVKAIAHGDLARAPYPSILEVGSALTTDEVLRQLTHEEHPSHRSAYIHMLGATGDDVAREWLDARIDAAWRARDASDLAALLAADVELRGPERLARIEMQYLLDPTRGLDEIEAALLALRLHGETDQTVPRRDVVAIYGRFLTARPAMAGFVAMELAEWGEWGATGDFVALLNADAIPDPAGAFAVLSYVQRSPDAAAKSKLDLLDD